MGFFKKVFGSAVEEVKKNLEDSKNEMLKNLEDKKNELLKNLNEKKDESLGELGFKSSRTSDSSASKHTNGDNARKQATSLKQDTCVKELEPPKKLWWVDDLELLYNGDKYALKYTRSDKRKTTDYIYDDVDILNEYQARIAQKQADGSMLYGVACTCGWKFLLTDCEYTKVTFLDGIGAVLAIDEDGDKYAIDRWGKPYALEVYREKVEEDMVEEDMNDNE